MDHAPCDFVVDIDIENGASPESFSADKRFFNNVCEDQQLIKAENELYVKDDHELSRMCTDHKVKGLVAENHVEKKDKRKSISAKKPSRPPRGLSLDAADQKLIKEIAKIALIKRARIERIKALKKMKAAKSSSIWAGSVYSFLFALLFFLVLYFQGFWFGSQGWPRKCRNMKRSVIGVNFRMGTGNMSIILCKLWGNCETLTKHKICNICVPCTVIYAVW